jgi:hypothetical protein
MKYPKEKVLTKGNDYFGNSPDPDKNRDGTGYMTIEKQL